MADEKILNDVLINESLGDLGRLEESIKSINKYVNMLGDDAKKAFKEFGSAQNGKEINKADDIAKGFSKTLRNLIPIVKNFTNSSDDASAILKKLGVSGKYVEKELNKLDSTIGGMAKTSQYLTGNLIKMSTVFGVLGGAMETVANRAGTYNRVIYDSVRASNAFGHASKETRDGLKAMGQAVGLNEKAAASFYRTWIKFTSAMVPATKQMVNMIKILGDEFGNTEEDINNVLGKLGKLERMKIGIDLKYVEDLRDGLVDTADVMTKMSRIRLLDPDGAEEYLTILERIRISGSRDDDVKKLKTLSDLTANLKAQVDAFIAANGDKIHGLIQGTIKVVTTLLNLFSKIPAPLLQAVVVFQTMKFLTGGIRNNFQLLMPLIQKIAGFLPGMMSVGSVTAKIGGKSRLFSQDKVMKGAAGGPTSSSASSFGVDFENLIASIRTGAKNTWEFIGIGAKKTWEFIGIGLEKAWNFLTADLGKAFSSLTKKIKDSWKSIDFKSVKKKLGAGFDSLWVGTKQGSKKLGASFMKLRSKVSSLVGVYGPLIAAVAVFVGAFYAASKTLDSYHGKGGKSAQSKALAGYDDVFRMQQNGKMKEAEARRLQVEGDYSKVSKGVGSVATGVVAGGAAGVGIGTLMLGLGAIGPVGWGAAVALGAVTGATVGLVKAAEASAKVTTADYTAKMTTMQIAEGGIVVSKEKTKLMQKENEQIIEGIRVARFGNSKWGKVKEFFVSEMPATVALMKKSLNLYIAYIKKVFSILGTIIGKYISIMSTIYEALSGFIGRIFGIKTDKKEGVFDYEVALVTKNRALGKDMLGIQKKIAINNDMLIEAYASKNKNKIKELESERAKLNQHYYSLAIRRRKNQLLISDREIAKIRTSGDKNALVDAEVAALKKAKEQIKLEGKRYRLITDINKKIVAANDDYKTQKTILNQIIQSNKAIYELQQKQGKTAGASASLLKSIEYAKTLFLESQKSRKELEKLGRAIIGMSDGDKNKKRIELQEKIEKAEKELESANSGGEDEAQQARIDVKKEELAVLRQLLASLDDEVAMVAAVGKINMESVEAQNNYLSLIKEVGGEYNSELELLKARKQLGAAQLDMTKSFMGGIGLTYEMQIRQLGRVRETSDKVGQVVAAKLQMFNKLIAEQKKLEGQLAGTNDKGKIDRLNAEIGANSAARIEAEKSLTVAQSERLNLVKEELDLTKELRYGYLSALQSQALAAGQFSKIIFTRDQNLGEMMDNMRTKGMQERALKDKTDVGASTFSVALGGRVTQAEAKAINSNRNKPSEMTTTGFINNFEGAGGPNELMAAYTGMLPPSVTMENLFTGQSGNTTGNGAFGAVAATSSNISVVAGGAFNDAINTPPADVAAANGEIAIESKRRGDVHATQGIPQKFIDLGGSRYGASYSAPGQYTAIANSGKSEAEKIKEAIKEGAKEGAKEGVMAGLKGKDDHLKSDNKDRTSTSSNRGTEIIPQHKSRGFVPNYASEGFPGIPKGTDTERYMLGKNDVILNRNANKIFKRNKSFGKAGFDVTSGGGRIKGNGNIPYYLTAGERVISGEQASKIGLDMLGTLNSIGNSYSNKGNIMSFGGKIMQGGQGSGRVNIGGIDIGYNYNPELSSQQNDNNLITHTINEVESKLRESMINRNKAKAGV